MIFFASNALNQSDLVAKEAEEAGASEIRQTKAGVEFVGTLETGYRFCMNSRIATRLLEAIYLDDDIMDTDELYESTKEIPWEEFINPDTTIKVTKTAQDCPYLNNSHFAALRVKDGIIDRIKEKFNDERPDVDTENPDITVHVHLHQKRAIWYLDFSGEGMQKRGYRRDQTDAVLKEQLAAALLYRSEWKKSVEGENSGVLLDPFVGSGTIVIEAALIASDTAPGLIKRDDFAFKKLPSFDEELWNKVVLEAEEKRQKAIDERDIRIYASDISPKAIRIAKENARAAGVLELIDFKEMDFASYKESDVPSEMGYIVTDPPYGIRMRNNDMAELYAMIGDQLSNLFKGWKATIMAADSELLSNIAMKPERVNSLYNGAVFCQAAHYSIFTDAEKEEMRKKSLEKKMERLSAPLSAGAEMAYNRLMKNLKEIRPIMEKEGVTCYRIYDADMPEYSAAIDVYENKWINLAEYAAPDTINPEDAERRLNELIYATERATGIDIENIFVKQRKEMKGKAQYTRLAASNRFNIVHENGLNILVNFQDYLDTGIFLDHRKIRAYIQSISDSKRFLNLFCYTGTATLNAIKGGALSTVSVDSSATYLDWAMQNLKVNGYPLTIDNYFYKSDVMDYLYSTYDRFDLIFCDPPTFSNSKSRATFDIQRDHKKLIKAAMMHLSPGGLMIFSNNFRRFKMDESIFDEYVVKEITEETIGEDFRDKKIHRVYLIRNKVKVNLRKNPKRV